MKNFISALNWYEVKYLIRYAANGILNTLIGFFVILVAMEFGFSPIISNIFGYVVGLIIGYFISKNIIFKSNGYIVMESVKYLFSFIISFLLNLGALYYMINVAKWSEVPSQIFAGIIYSIFMYLLSRLLVFSSKKNFH